MSNIIQDFKKRFEDDIEWKSCERSRLALFEPQDSLASRRAFRVAQGPGAAGTAPGSPFLCLLSFCEAKESKARLKRENQRLNKDNNRKTTPKTAKPKTRGKSPIPQNHPRPQYSNLQRPPVTTPDERANHHRPTRPKKWRQQWANPICQPRYPRRWTTNTPAVPAASS